MIDFILTKFQNLRFLGQFPTLLDPYRQRLLKPQNLSKIRLFFILLCRIIIIVIVLKQLVASGDVNIGEQSPRRRLRRRRLIFN